MKELPHFTTQRLQLCGDPSISEHYGPYIAQYIKLPGMGVSILIHLERMKTS